jgi:hypothetical protein
MAEPTAKQKAILWEQERESYASECIQEATEFEYLFRKATAALSNASSRMGESGFDAVDRVLESAKKAYAALLRHYRFDKGVEHLVRTFMLDDLVIALKDLNQIIGKIDAAKDICERL